MLEDKIIILDSKAKTKEEALTILANELVTSGAVKATYPMAILKREKNFPTGLSTDSIGFAIPHTDAEHVNRDQVGLLRLQNTVEFLQMGDGQAIQVKIIFMLALSKPHEQLEMLQKLISIFQNKKMVSMLLQESDPQMVIATLNSAGIA
ncbi:PTS system, galactitol-specific IIA component, putative [Leuconostoc kimchii IMSNU 11154]|uniref:PTS system, galactitol-specific IIA component, putative n=1 Tax=Leuconostoc kimchii (strain IMSNU 11154 / KCTC 2386 / IH25) TaxID=762051 RepID=D5T5B2_LEUKI|nr:PTS sugar transporter subunit IIA [Leuconostoc kimchii]ADG41242.1 PTS system, galactitol-specific IIA component, putative [Leuconostoc kimchii IMSNU 11154]